MLSNNPFSILAETIAPIAMQGFIIAMVLLIAVGTIIQMVHHKNLTYFFNNAKKAKLAATKELGIGEKTSIIAKTAVVDIGTAIQAEMTRHEAADLIEKRQNEISELIDSLKQEFDSSEDTVRSLAATFNEGVAVLENETPSPEEIPTPVEQPEPTTEDKPRNRRRRGIGGELTLDD